MVGDAVAVIDTRHMPIAVDIDISLLPFSLPRISYAIMLMLPRHTLLYATLC